jgi:hypothetical protein
MFRVATPTKSKQQLELVNGLLVTLLQRLKLSTDPNGNIPSAEVVDLVRRQCAFSEPSSATSSSQRRT